MKNTSGAKRASSFLTDPETWAATFAKMIRAVQRTEQMMAATKETKKNNFMSRSLHPQWSPQNRPFVVTKTGH
jgi:hypothetical protein